jgi:hypothetical protein
MFVKHLLTETSFDNDRSYLSGHSHESGQDSHGQWKLTELALEEDLH